MQAPGAVLHKTRIQNHLGRHGEDLGRDGPRSREAKRPTLGRRSWRALSCRATARACMETAEPNDGSRNTLADRAFRVAIAKWTALSRKPRPVNSLPGRFARLFGL